MSRAGLERWRWVETIEAFVRQCGNATPRWAIFLTYEIDINTLTRSVLPLLARRGRRFRSVVLVDQGALESALDVMGPLPPIPANLHPVRPRHGGVFHPKLVLLRAGHHVRACVGSSNITSGGLGNNLELWTHTESTELIGALHAFLRTIIDSADLALDDGARRSLRRALCGIPEARSRAVWSSLDEPFSRRLRSGPERRARRAIIVSPMYAGPGGVSAARKAIPAGELQLYTTARVKVPSSSLFVYDPPHRADQTSDDSESFPGTLHAKAYVFPSTASAWVGSANFTAKALTRSVRQGGNVELMMRATLPPDEMRALEADLKLLFSAPGALASMAPVDVSAPPTAAATILACELLLERGSPSLLVHASIRTGHVHVEYQGRRLKVWIRAGRGLVSGERLRAFLPRIEPFAPCALVIHQRLGRMMVPIVVNVPHVPPELGPGGGQASLDALLDDLLGRIELPMDGAESDDDEPDAGERGQMDSIQTAEMERRLDEVSHQGQLDQLAVKAALLKRLVSRAKQGTERDGLMAEVLRALHSACPDHIRPSLRRLFGDIDLGAGA